jgi:hypothetical protein
MTRLLLAAALLAAAVAPRPAPAQDRPGSLGLVPFADLGGGGAVSGNDRDGSRGGLFESELGIGYQFPQGFRPELALLVGLAPQTYLGLRPGLHYSLEGLPFYVRAALDFASPVSSWRMRWVLAGAGAELRFTDQLGAFAEADLGIPVSSKAGFPFLLRGGLVVRL